MKIVVAVVVFLTQFLSLLYLFYLRSSLANPVLDAWFGARKWVRSLNGSLQTVSVTREEYNEKGGEYLKEHFASNLYVPTPPQS